jgi:L-lactate dehydrogenase complex protein LldG
LAGRGEMLKRIREALGRSQQASASSTQFPPLGLVMPPIDPENCVPKFEAELRKVAGNTHRVANREELEQLFRDILEGSPPVVLSRNPLIAQLGLEGMFRALGLEVAVWPSPGASEAAIRGFRDRCFEAVYGITGVDFALAETGSLILSSTTEGSQLASLAPPVHIALYRRSQVLASLEDVLEQASVAHLDHSGRSVVFITGPSRTADIEQILIRGVHGPRHVHAILVEETCLEGGSNGQ